MTESLTARDSHDLLYWAEQAEAAAGIIRLIVLTPIFPEGLKRWQNPDAKADERQLDYEGSVATGVGVLLAGRELGMDPMTSLRSITVVKGTVTLYAMAMRALMTNQGHELVIRDSTDFRCVIDARRRGADTGWQRFEWDLDRAKKANLYPGYGNNSNWRTQTKAMLLARCSSEASRYTAPDALLGMPAIYEELIDSDAEAALAIERSSGEGNGQATAPKQAKRRNAPARAALPAAPPPAADAKAAEPEPTIPPISTAQRNRLFALLKTLGKGDQKDRKDALDLIGGMLTPPRKLSSTGDLLAPEASTIITGLEELVKVAAEDQSQQGKPGHAPKDETPESDAELGDREKAVTEAVADQQPKSADDGDDWPPDTAGASANE